jgi:pimeloyl-ACP methyl ester carboxylesterase
MGTPTLVFLHGVGLDHTVWEPVTELLAGRVKVVTLDLPGHGSRAPVGADVTLADLAAGVVADLEPGAHLIGFSLGALVAQYLAIQRPDLVASLTSVSSVCRRTAQERSAVLDRLRAAESDFAASIAASLHRWYDGTEVDASRVRQTRTVLEANDPQSFVNCYRVFATADAEIADQLGDISVPSLAVIGECDPGSTPEMTRRLAAAIPNCEAVVVPGARHMLPVERPRELANALSTFVGRYAHV